MKNLDELMQAISISLIVAGFLLKTCRFLKAIELCRECLFFLKGTAGIIDEKYNKLFYKIIYFTMWKANTFISDNTNAMNYAEKLLETCRESGDRVEEYLLSKVLAEMYFRQNNYTKVKGLSEEMLLISKEIRDRNGEASAYVILGTVYGEIGQYEKAIDHLEKSLVINKEIGNRNREAAIYANLGSVYKSVREYEKARDHQEKSLAIHREIGDRNGEAASYENLAIVYQSVGEYEKARDHLEKSLAIRKETEDRNGEATSYSNLGIAHHSVGEYEKAIDYYEKSLAIQKEIGDRKGEAASYGNLGTVYQSVSKYEKAREHLEKSLAIRKEIGDRNGEATSRANLGDVYQSVGENKKARDHVEKSLAIQKEIGDRNGEAVSYRILGNVYQAVGEYEKARDYHEKSLVIHKEIGNRKGEAASYSNLGLIYHSVGDYENASRCWGKELALSENIRDRHQKANSYHKLGTNFLSLGKYSKANEYNQKALVIFKEIGDRAGVAACYLAQGTILMFIRNVIPAKEWLEKAIATGKEIGDKKLEAASCLNYGILLFNEAEYVRGEEYIMNGLVLSELTGDIVVEYRSLQVMAHLRLKEGKIQEAISYFLSGIEKCEKMRGSLLDNDQFKISFLDLKITSYRELSTLLCNIGNASEALYVSELSKARALADLMSTRYSVEIKIPANPGSLAGIEGIVTKECNLTCLYVSYCSDNIYLWILNASGVQHFHTINGNELIASEGLSQQLEEFFKFRRFGILPEELCEDRSLHGFYPESKSREEENYERIGKESEANQGPKMNLPICYKLFIAPVARFLEGPEITIVPDRALYRIPFAALTDVSGKYLSQTFRIRIAPSLATLKLINESPADYHCQTGALIVGNPDVGEVHFRGRLTNISRLPSAEDEARMVGEKLNVEPLLGQQATKQAVIKAMDSVALIHIAAHGDAEKGEIALAPSFRIPNGIPQEGLYLLTMSDISKIQLRAKLVVLSCCHSARGQTKAEGAVGIARAFLGSGARSVLVALWALDDKATEQLMSHFYDHLVAGESAGESLHEAMKWMRSKGYDVKQWAPFILIGDDVTFDFRKTGMFSLKTSTSLLIAKGSLYLITIFFISIALEIRVFLLVTIYFGAAVTFGETVTFEVQ